MPRGGEPGRAKVSRAKVSIVKLSRAKLSNATWIGENKRGSLTAQPPGVSARFLHVCGATGASHRKGAVESTQRCALRRLHWQFRRTVYTRRLHTPLTHAAYARRLHMQLANAAHTGRSPPTAATKLYNFENEPDDQIYKSSDEGEDQANNDVEQN